VNVAATNEHLLSACQPRRGIEVLTRRIAIMTDEPGWHGEVLRAAFMRRRCEAVFVSLAECRIDLDCEYGLFLPGFPNALPDGVLVRGIAAGTLEQITLRLGVLHALRELGVPVYNDARAIERSVDKSMTSFLLKTAGVPTLPTWVTESADQARHYLLRETAAGRELVIKPLFGSQGVGLKRLATPADLPAAAEYNEVFYLQSFVDTGEGRWHDWRVFVVGHRAVAAMIRRGKHWINNVSQGAACEFASLNKDLRRLSEGATLALNMDYAGVDIIRDCHGQSFVVEVNSMPAWAGLQEVSEFDIAQVLVDDFLARRLPLHALDSVSL
jgi:tetrahydromethanopterin:alpha-L-glutamate ligase